MRVKKKFWQNKNLQVFAVGLLITAIFAGAAVLALKMREPRTTLPPADFNLTIVPETTLKDIREKLFKAGFSYDEIDSAFARTYTHPLLASKPAGVNLEGYIFPDTYNISTKAKVSDVLVLTFDTLYNKLEKDGSLDEISRQGMTIHEVLTVASIVGKEASKEEDQKKITAVFWNRLRSGMTMGADPTYQYAYREGLCKENNRNCDSRYNTRKYGGLPPGPIANMTYSTIQAVLHPIANNYKYFVASENGTIYYSTTEEGHLNNVRLYCGSLCK